MAISSTIARIRDTELSMLRAGSGPKMLLLHGAYDGPGSNEDQWLPYMAELAKSFDVIVPRHPGFGAEMPDWLDNVADLANFYLDFLTAENLTNVHLVGASLGGWIAADLAARNTSRLASLALIAPYGVRLPGVQGVDLYASSDDQALRDVVENQTLADALIAKSKDPDGEDAWLHTRVTLAQLTWQPRLFDPFLQKWLHRIDIPTLLIWGDEDKVVPAAIAGEWQRLLPTARLEILQACGHLPTLEQPDIVANLIRHAVAAGSIAA